MKKKEAIKQADEFHAETGQHAFVVDTGGTFEWYCKDYFDHGFNDGYIVYGTDKG